ncbi:F-box/FBD/LRR-repeat protein At1g78750 [Medicago truncatula]|uniref:Cytochrome C biogenesis protein ccsA, putative n=1 Tax=Medicago truncatula TaxID=3880 RepID=A0A072UTZ8_MEDTR|nr:F-box/FBD/LRR-repeat protein At1g78750 [Medicago truncatula]KEH32811.1 cytochrome C biogenesis protein ccsA, putative [Medicago truncatula]
MHCLPKSRLTRILCLFLKQQWRHIRGKDNKNKHTINDLTDDVLLHILSFLKAKEAVQTCILSKRWINLWKILPTLTLSSSHFRTSDSFEEFVSQILSLRDGSITIRVLDFQRNYCMEHSLLQRIIKYVVSHNVQHLIMDFPCDINHFPSCFFSCQTLTSLNLSGFHILFGHKLIFPNFLNLPALTSLSLKYFAFQRGDDNVCVEPFSTFKMLNSLIIDCCIVMDAQNLCISSTKLVSFTILMCDCDLETYIGTYFELELYAPCLHTFSFTGLYIPKLFGSKSFLYSIKHLNIHLWCYWNLKSAETSPLLLNWLVELANIESLTVSSNTLEVLSLVPDLLNVELSYLCNLKSLKIKTYLSSSIPDGMIDLLIQNSPSAKVDILQDIIR